MLRQRLGTDVTLDELHALCREHSEALGFQHFVHALRVPTHFADARLIVIDDVAFATSPFRAAELCVKWGTGPFAPPSVPNLEKTQEDSIQLAFFERVK